MNTETPWLPSDIDESFAPLSHFDITPTDDMPMAVTPRGGGREVGRSCYQLDTQYGTYLIDCGLSQGGDDKFPDLRGLSPDDVDSVFLTHAHIDHSGGLPVLENRGLLDDDAKIFATEPTIQIAQTLLQDSLKLHLRETADGPAEQQFTEADVESVFRRFSAIEYTTDTDTEPLTVRDLIPETDEVEPLTLQVGNAAHLLGSAWFAFESHGHRVVFSGDIGGRAKQLPEIDVPPQADHLFIESTYGATHSHRSLSDAGTELFELLGDAIRNGEPVLIPTFATGRAQALLLMFNDRGHALPGEIGVDYQLVVDGMAQDITDHYHDYVTDNMYYDTGVVNRATETGMTTPFLPSGITTPRTDRERRRIFERFSPAKGEQVPIILAPSGMLSGGNSPRYLGELIARYDDGHVVPTGYQANGTLGNALQNAKKSGTEKATRLVDTNPFGNDWPASDRISWVETDDGTKTRMTVPTRWLHSLSGLSAHAAQNGLLSFARNISPETITLIHGPAYAQEGFGAHLMDNVESSEQLSRARLLTPIPIKRDPDIDAATLSEDVTSSSGEIRTQIDDLHDTVTALSEEIADTRNDGLSEAEVRAIVRDMIN